MQRSRFPVLLFVLLFAGVAACGSMDRQQTLTLETKLPFPFAQISNVVELRDGSVMFAETRDRLFLRADFRNKELDTVGTRVDSLPAGGPASSYRFPGWVARLAGDTVALVDFSAVRTTLWDEGGRSLGVLPIAQVAGQTPVLLYDTLGHGYKVDYQAVLGGGEPGQTIRPDSIPVLQISLKGGAIDTVANLAGPEYGEATFGNQVQTAAKVFGPNDFFGVLPDGAVWVARGRDNRVDWRSPRGEWIRGTPRKYTPVPVTQEDRDRALAQVRERGKQFGMPQGLTIKYPFAEHKAPFDQAVSDPDGNVWLQRSRATADEPVRYDIIDRGGKWQREVVLPAGASLAGFGKDGVVYASIREGERRALARFRMQ